MEQSLQMIRLDLIKPNPFQPRTEFVEEKIKSLAESIKEHGLLQPIIVLKEKENYFIVGGERRFKAHQLLGLEEIEAKVIENVENSLKFLRDGAVVENALRENLTIEETIKTIIKLYEALDEKGKTIKEQQMSFEEIGKLFGKKSEWARVRYELAKRSKTFLQMIYDGEYTVAWWEGIKPFLENYPSLENELYKALINKRWSSKSELRDFVSNCKKENTPIEFMKCTILYPQIFTKKALEALNLLDKDEKILAARNFVSFQEDSEDLKITEEIVIEYVNSTLSKKEANKRVNDFQEKMTKENEEALKKLEEVEKEYQKEKAKKEKQIAEIEASKGKSFSSKQKEELRKLEEQYQKKVKEIKKQEEEAIELEKAKIFEKEEKIKKLMEKQKERKLNKYENPFNMGTDFLLDSLFKMDVYASDWHGLDIDYEINDMPQKDFEIFRDSVNLICKNLKRWNSDFEKIQIYVNQREGSTISIIDKKEEKKSNLKLINTEKR